MALLAIELSLLQQCCSDRCSEDWQCVGMARTTPAKLPLPLEGSALPSSTWLLWPKSSSETASRSVQPFLYGSNAMLYNALLMGKKTPKIAPSPLGFRHPAGRGPNHGHRQHSQKDLAYGSRDMTADRQTDTNTDVLITILRHSFRMPSTKDWNTKL